MDAADTAAGVFDVLPQAALIVGPAGSILQANATWRRTNDVSCGCEPRCGVGAAYRTTCEFRAMPDQAAARLTEALQNPGPPGSSTTVHSNVVDLSVQALPKSRVLLLWSSHPEDTPGIDPLTGVMDRGQFDRRLKASLAGPQGRLSLAFLDLDGFKVINDTFGHAEGDRVLAWAAWAIMDTVGTSGRVARLGGDEFAVLSALPVDELRQLIVTVIDNIRHTSRASGFTLPLSASAGVVEAVAPIDGGAGAGVHQGRVDGLVSTRGVAGRRDDAWSRSPGALAASSARMAGTRSVHASHCSGRIVV